MDLHQQLEEIFQTVFGDELLTINDSLSAQDVDGWDSRAHINLMVSIEDAFGIQFADEQLTQFQNVGELKQFLAVACQR